MPRKGKRTKDVLHPGAGGPEHTPGGHNWNVGNLPPPRFKVEAHPPPVDLPNKIDWPPLREIVVYKLWKNSRPSVKERTRIVQRGMLCHALAELPERPVPADVIAWHRGLVEILHQLPQTANVNLAVLSSAYTTARDFGGQLANPCKLCEPFKTEGPDGPALGGQEAAAEIYERCRVVCDEAEKVALCILRFFIVRRGELVALLPEDCDPRAATLSIHRQRDPAKRDGEPFPLKSAARVFSLDMLPDRERAELLALFGKGGGSYREQNQFGAEVQSKYVFPWSHETIRNGLMRKLRAVASESFPSGKALHQWRHVGSELTDQQTGRDMRELQAHGGWKTSRSADRYINKRSGLRMRAETVAKLRQANAAYTPTTVLRQVLPRSRVRALVTQAEARPSGSENVTPKNPQKQRGK